MLSLGPNLQVQGDYGTGITFNQALGFLIYRLDLEMRAVISY